MVKKYAGTDFERHSDVFAFYLLKKDGTYNITTVVDFDYNLDDVKEAYARLQTGEMKPVIASACKPETPLSLGTVITVYTKDGEYKTVYVLSISDDEIEVFPLKAIMENAILTQDVLTDICQQRFFKLGYFSVTQLMVIKYKDIQLIMEDVL